MLAPQALLFEHVFTVVCRAYGIISRAPCRTAVVLYRGSSLSAAVYFWHVCVLRVRGYHPQITWVFFLRMFNVSRSSFAKCMRPLCDVSYKCFPVYSFRMRSSGCARRARLRLPVDRCVAVVCSVADNFCVCALFSARTSIISRRLGWYDPTGVIGVRSLHWIAFTCLACRTHPPLLLSDARTPRNMVHLVSPRIAS